MFGFLIKKNFCDGWDNLFILLIVNLVFLLGGVAVFAGWYAVVQFSPASDNELLSFIIIALGIILLFIVYSIVAFSFGEQAAVIADFGGVHIADFFKTIPSVLKDACLFGLMCAGITIVSIIGIRWYFTQGSYLYLFMGCVFIWFDVFAVITLQWFIAVRSLLHNNFKKCLKKSLILMLDNTSFSFALAFYDFILVLFSIFFMGLFPSVAGIMINRLNALRLRMYKYDYLELHPELKTKRERNDIPWEELIYEDRETLGPRKFRTFIFPWKD
ncbi:MAG: hypothetical protein MJ181_02420 [Treponema sp.]|nr:hypothetical protein [Treponema sp.]